MYANIGDQPDLWDFLRRASCCKAAVEKGVGAKSCTTQPGLFGGWIDQFALPDLRKGTVEREKLCCRCQRVGQTYLFSRMPKFRALLC